MTGEPSARVSARLLRAHQALARVQDERDEALRKLAECERERDEGLEKAARIAETVRVRSDIEREYLHPLAIAKRIRSLKSAALTEAGEGGE